MWRNISTVFLFALPLGAQAPSPDFLPLEPGNQWVLETATAPKEILNIQVHRSKSIDGFTYHLLSGFAAVDIWVRRAPGAELFARDMKTGSEEKIAHLGFGVPAYRTELSGCVQEAQPAFARPEPAGHLSVTYAPGSCRDVGLSEEVYAPGMGLIRRTVNTIRGATTYLLAHARVGGKVITGDPKELLFHYSFSHGATGWLAGFSDYSLVNGDMHFLAESRVLPPELGSGNRQGFFLQSMNRSDDMFMFLKKGVYLTDGLKPNQRYSLSFEITFASNAQDGCVGAGGAPGEGVYLKAGASVDEPVSIAGAGQHLELNIDKGHQSQGGFDAGIAGTIANGESCDPANARYVRVRKAYEHDRPVSTDDRAQLWLMLGTDSAYEGLTALFYESVTVRLKEVE